MAFNLSEVQATVNLPDNFTDDEKQIAADKIIEAVKERTRKGIDSNGKAFKYVPNSKFEGNNLEQSGDTLLELQVISISGNQLIYGYPDDNFESRKAHGNETGSYGQDQGDSRKAKPFVAISGSDLNLIIEEIESSRTNSDLDETTKISNAVFNRLFG